MLELRNHRQHASVLAIALWLNAHCWECMQEATSACCFMHGKLTRPLGKSLLSLGVVPGLSRLPVTLELTINITRVVSLAVKLTALKIKSVKINHALA